MLHSLQACRGIAALLVVLLHASESIFSQARYFGHKPYGQIFDIGLDGVNFFFVLSGFLMILAHQQDFGKPQRLGSYLGKRFFRIYPTYWVALALVAAVFFLAPHLGAGHERQWSSIVTSIFLIPRANADHYLILGVAWTLVFEVCFYLLFGLLILSKRFGLLVFAAWTIGVCFHSSFTTFPGNFIFSSYNLYFLMGIAAALVHTRCRVPYPRLLACVGGLLYFATAYWNVYQGPMNLDLKTLGIGLGSALLALGTAQAEQADSLRIPRWLSYLGSASYAIYLVHVPGLSLCAKLMKAAAVDTWIPGAILFWILVAGGVLAGCVFHEVVERPILAFSRRRRTQTRQPSLDADPEPTRKAA